jgi:4-amino-4-deoxy-L-arabinose transferase-like glycosyltransferase
VLSLPLVWCGRRRWKDLLRLPSVGAFLIVALPWYLLCYLRNGAAFRGRSSGSSISSASRPIPGAWAAVLVLWPVLAAALMPWTPLFCCWRAARSMPMRRRRFLLLWLLFVVVFFSLSKNKLPGYLLPLAPAAAA